MNRCAAIIVYPIHRVIPSESPRRRLFGSIGQLKPQLSDKTRSFWQSFRKIWILNLKYWPSKGGKTIGKSHTATNVSLSDPSFDERLILQKAAYVIQSAGIQLGYRFRSYLRRTDLITTYNAASAGAVVNQIERVHNGFGQLTHEYQEHDGSVTGSRPFVDYSYSEAAGGVNHSRATSMTYASGYTLN
jgi:hypothetical protein